MVWHDLERSCLVDQYRYLGTRGDDAVVQMIDRNDTAGPHRVAVTARFLAEAATRQRTYEARRRIWTAAFHPSDPRAQAAPRSRPRGAIHDPRQGKLDL